MFGLAFFQHGDRQCDEDHVFQKHLQTVSLELVLIFVMELAQTPFKSVS